MKKALFLSTTVLAGTLVAAPAFAQRDLQDSPTPVSVISAEDLDQGVTTVDEVLISTGTRLLLPDYTSPNPTISADAEQIEKSGDGSLIEFLLDTPALIASIDDVQASESSTPFLSGLNLLDLRNLGTTRTLTLVNGRRHVASAPGTSAVDIGSIPLDLVERIDVVTGGQSAVYGADGVSGVVNFILKDNFDGLTVRGQYGDSADGGGATQQFSVLYGRNFAGGEGNYTFNLEYYNRDDVEFDDREYTRRGVRATLFDNPDYDPDVEGSYQLIPQSNLRYIDTSPGGSIFTTVDGFFDTLPDFNGDGTVFNNAPFRVGFISVGGDGTLLDEFNDDLIPGVERFSANFSGNYWINPNIRAFAELKYARSEADFEEQPSYDYGLLIPIENPYIPATALADANTNPDSIVPLLDFFFGEEGVLVARDNIDLGRERYFNTNEVKRGVIGFNGLLPWNNMDFEVSYVWGKAEQEVRGTNLRQNDRWFASIDAVDDGFGNIVCRSDIDPDYVPFGDIFAQYAFVPEAWGTEYGTFTPGPNSGCTPVNIFGEGNITQAQRDWINTDVVDRAEIEQNVLTAFLRGDTSNFWSFGYGGPISYVLGAEYRDESSTFTPDPATILAAEIHYPITNGGEASITDGSFHVSEIFGEVNLPIIEDQPFGKEVSLQLAYRYSNYSTAGEAHTYNLGGKWAFNDTIMIRGSLAQAVRAPNVNNLFRGQDQTFATIVDPCSSDRLLDGDFTSTRSVNCAADLNPLGLTVGTGPSDYEDTSSEAIGGFLAGNLLLDPETAYTKTLGFVYTPTYIPGLLVSADYYDIRIEDAIASYTAQTIVNNCYDLPRPNPFCDLIERNEDLTSPALGRINNFLQVPGNLARFNTRGIDFTVRYFLDPMNFGATTDYGTFDFRLTGTFLDRLRTKATDDAPVTLDDGDEFAPTFQASFDVSWERGPWGINYGLSYFNETRRISRTLRVSQPDYVSPEIMDYSARKEHDIRVSYTYDDRFEFYGGVNNFTDQQPELQDFYYPVSPLGRFFYVGARANFR